MIFVKRLLRIFLPNFLYEKLKEYLFSSFFSAYHYHQDGLATQHNCDFMKDPRFMRAYSAGEKTGSWGAPIHWRAFVVCWAAQSGLKRDGDFVECGVNRGGFAAAVLEYTELFKTQKKFYLLDTFCGLVDTQISEEERVLGVKGGGYEDCYDSVVKTFSAYTENVVIIKGMVPETLTLVPSERIAFLSIDMNCAKPEIEAVEYFWDKLSSGAIIVLDDYGWPGRIVQKTAFDKFCYERDVQVLALPTGQGLIIKP